MSVTRPPGEVVPDGDGVVLRFDRVLPAPVAWAWGALADSERCGLWYGTWAGDPSTGRVLVTPTAEEGAPTEEVAVEECARPHRLVVAFGAPGTPVWRVALDLRDAGATTALRLTQRFASAQDAAAAAPGWHFYLDRMASVVSGERVTQRWEDYAGLAP